jgi:CheY-like chemotaxis protein/two-component sensor histidine kinase
MLRTVAKSCDSAFSFLLTDCSHITIFARKSNEAQDALLAMLGHELRNPVAAVTGALDVIADHRPEESLYISSFDILKRQINHLVMLVDDMLDLTRLTTGRIRLRLEPVDLLEPLQHALQAAESLFVTRNHRLSTKLPAQAVLLNADRARIEQIFSNLLINAAKYTEPGGEIEVSVQCQSHYAIVSIRDNGMGIDPEVIPRLFDLFSQVNPALDRSEAGLGIGLTVVRNLVELHGGDVEATSEGAGKGSEFVVRLPLGTAAPQKVPEKPEIAKVNSKQLRVMIVEDNEDIAYVMQALVAQCGHAARRAGDGPAALLLAKEWQPEVGLIDIGLPGMSGYEIACVLRNDIETRSMFLVALTGFGQEDDRLRAQEAGFHRHVVKPISLDVLNGLLRDAAEASNPLH